MTEAIRPKGAWLWHGNASTAPCSMPQPMWKPGSTHACTKSATAGLGEGGRRDRQSAGRVWIAEQGCSAMRSLLGNLQASICSSQAIYQQQGVILPCVNPTLISANVPSTRACGRARQGLFERGAARGGEVRLHSQREPPLVDL